MMRVAVVTSHPIQNHAPWFRALAEAVDLEVLFCHRQTGAGQAAAGFGRAFDWDVPLLEGYRHRWLENISAQPNVSSFRGCDTPGVGKALREGHFDACIVTGWYLKSYIQAVRACWRQNVPVLMRGDSHLGTPRTLLTTAAKYLPYRWMLGRMDAHLYVGQANRAYLRHYGVPDSHLFFVPHFVDNDRFDRAARKAREDGTAARFRATIGVPPNATVFLFAGKFLPDKRASDFINALTGLRASGRLVHGLVIGAGPEDAALRLQADVLDAPVYFSGFRNQSQMPAAYAAADCVVVPSAHETWGLVVNEGMACGLPAIASDAVGCVEDLIVPGETGFVFPAGDVPALWERMSQCVDALEQDRHRFEPAVRAHVARYGTDAAVAGTLEALDAVTRGAPREAADSDVASTAAETAMVGRPAGRTGA